MWASLPHLSKPRSFAAAVSTGEDGRAVGSCAASLPGRSAALLPSQARASFLSPVPCAANEVFVVGGGSGVEWFDSVVRYDRHAGLTGSWQELAPLQVRPLALGRGGRGGRAAGTADARRSPAVLLCRSLRLPTRRCPVLPGPVRPAQVARGSLAGAMASGYLFVYGGGKPQEQYNVVEWWVAYLPVFAP